MIGLLSLVNPDRNLFWGIVPTIVGIVSLIGTLVAIKEIRRGLKQWYFGIPHAFVLIVLCITGPIFLITEGGSHVDYLYIPFGLLSVTSIGFFLSFPDARRKVTKKFALLSGIISIYSIVSVYFVIRGLLSPLRTSWSVITALEMIYWLILMPVIGLCYIATALTPGENQAIGSGEMLDSGENQ
jgi:hypothetical protein